MYDVFECNILLLEPGASASATSNRRRDGAGSLKSAKDREQSAFLIEAMAEDRPDDLAGAYGTAMEVGPRWREHIGNSLKWMPETKTILDNLGA